MAMNGYMGDELDVMCEDLFENIEDFFDFSNEDEAFEIVGSGVHGANIAAAKSTDVVVAAPPPPPPLCSSDSSDGCRVTAEDEGKICEEINIGEDWISNFLDDDTNFEIDFPATIVTGTATATATTPAFTNKDDESLFRSFSPVSVLEPNNLTNKGGSSFSSSSSSSSSTNSITNEVETASLVAPVGPTMMLVPARARSKRPRRVAPVSTTLPILPPSSDGPPAIPTLLPEIECFEDSFPIPMKKKKKKTLATGANANAEDSASAVRKCMHCGIQKTPQWRAGPMGPKTLCNACGVRYKSGRLFPEYRPAASPTYVPSVHSNSHKKVVEMRNKVTQLKPVKGPVYPAAKNCDLLEYIRRKD